MSIWKWIKWLTLIISKEPVMKTCKSSNFSRLFTKKLNMKSDTETWANLTASQQIMVNWRPNPGSLRNKTHTLSTKSVQMSMEIWNPYSTLMC